MSLDGLLRASLSRSLQQNRIPSSMGPPAEIYELERHRDHCRHAKDYRGAQQLEDRLTDLKDWYEKNGLKVCNALQQWYEAECLPLTVTYRSVLH